MASARYWWLVMFLPLSSGCAWGGDDSADPCAGITCSYHGQCVVEQGTPVCQCAAGYRAQDLLCLQGAAGQATTLSADIHAGTTRVNFRAMVVGNGGADFDLDFFEGEGGPFIALAEGVKAKNLGSTTSFHEITEAPQLGYRSDSVDELAIGDSFRSGGSCHSGFTMNHNIYVLTLADGTFAKLEVLSAKEGQIELIGYRQPDGSTNLATEE